MEGRLRSKFINKNKEGEIICYKCKDYKPSSEFDINKKAWYRDFKDRRCRDCKKEQYIKRRTNSRGKRDLDRLLLERWHGLKDRSIKKNYIVDFNWQFLKELWEKQEGKCAISGIPMTYFMNTGRVSTNLSVDKIDSKGHYTIDNIQLVCMAVNQMKSDLSFDELISFCKNIIDYNEYKNKTI